MQTRITVEEMQAAARVLAKHERGRAAMKHLAAGVSVGALDLDLLDQRAFLALLGGAWVGQAEKVCTIVNEALTNPTDARSGAGAAEGAR